jgi:methylthioribose-1-phosphate isomerase
MRPPGLVNVSTRVCAFRAEEQALRVLDQRRLPAKEVWVTLRTSTEVAEAIATLAVRGAPLIGGAAAYGMWLGAWQARTLGSQGFRSALSQARSVLFSSRPTAVNLFHALNQCDKAVALGGGDSERTTVLLRETADAWVEADRQACLAMSRHGAALLPDEGGVLTHCNAGALATCGVGTALGVLRAAAAMGKRIKVYANETRPLLQGARLTVWELMKDGIDVTLLVDSAAPQLMRTGKVQAAVVGADRIAANGDVANKVGTYGVALACRHHGIPLWVAAPRSTLDFDAPHGRAITLENRAAEEVTTVMGQLRISPRNVPAYNPAFDVTPAELVSAIVTERGVVLPVQEEGLAALR